MAQYEAYGGEGDGLGQIGKFISQVSTAGIDENSSR